MALELITDRSDTDVQRARRLNSMDIRDMTADEIAELLAGGKGAYTHHDLNRVESAVQYLSALLAAHGYAADVGAIKTNWTDATVLSSADMERYLGNVKAIKATLNSTVSLPDSMAGITHSAANNIERLLLDIETIIERMIAAYRHSGTFNSGQGGLRI